MAAVPFASRSRLAVYALANAGGVIGFLPLLTLLLPIKIEELAPDHRIGLVTACTVAGLLAASVSNVAAGWWSDRLAAKGSGRRLVVASGLVATALSYGAIAAADRPGTLLAAVVLFQVAVNAMLGPFLAIMADEVPETRLGLAGGLLALANPIASAVSAAVLAMAVLGEGARFAVVAGAMVLLMLPLLLLPAPPPAARAQAGPRMVVRRDLAAAWVARLLVQIAGSVLFYYLLYVFESVVPGEPARSLAGRLGHLMTIAFLAPLPVAVIVGRWSDRIGRRKPFLLAAALVAGAGLAIMASAGGWDQAAAGFAVYAMGSAVFLGLHTTFAMQLLPDPAHRGRDLGLLNLTNTLPALIGPAMTWALAGPHDFALLLGVLAVVTASGGAVVLMVGGRRQAAYRFQYRT